MNNASDQAAGAGHPAAPAAPALPASTRVAPDRPTRSGAALLNMLAAPLGIVGLAGAWQALRTNLHAPAWPGEALFATGTAAWIVVTVAYLGNGLRRPGGFTADRRDPINGPYAGYLPAIGILAASHYVQYLHNTARGVVVVFVIALGILIAQLVAYWLLGNLPMATLHPGYFLPTVAGPFVASIGLGLSGWRHAAEGAFGVGVFLWLIIGGLIFNRLFTGTPLPDSVKPSFSVLVSAPATGGIAWFIISNGQLNTVEYMLLGITFLMLTIQSLLFSEYRRLRFTPNFWAFTFPASSSASLTIRWLSIRQFPYWHAWCWSITTVTTAAVLAIAAATVAQQVRRHTSHTVPHPS
jgi:tellurite resistance protein